MEIAVVVFEGITALDAIGPYEVLAMMPGASVRFCAATPGPVRTHNGFLGLVADAGLGDVGQPDIVLVPGGPGTGAAAKDDDLLDWLRRVHETTTWTTSVCTGSLILGAAGLLRGRRATTHWWSMDDLAATGAEAVRERVVVDGKLMTGAGVSAGIDLALRLAAVECGDLVAQRIQLILEYDPQPPFDSGSPAKAPAEVMATFGGRR
ncbi:MAG: DJ-1/PfpI family protein [Acidimicrobiales bacterium]